MLSFNVIPCGNFTAQDAGTLMYWPKPPAVFMPRSKPVTITWSPAPNWEVELVATTPAASIPGVCGYFLVTPLLPDADSASL